MATYPPRLNLRNANAHDIDRLVEIDKLSFNDCWNAATFQQYLTKPGYMLQAADWLGATVAYTLSQAIDHGVQLHRLAVNPQSRRQGVGARVVGDLLGRRTGYRPKVRVHVDEFNAEAIQFFGVCQFKGVGVKTVDGRDYFVMWNRLPRVVPSTPVATTNRVASFEKFSP